MLQPQTPPRPSSADRRQRARLHAETSQAATLRRKRHAEIQAASAARLAAGVGRYKVDLIAAHLDTLSRGQWMPEGASVSAGVAALLEEIDELLDNPRFFNLLTDHRSRR
jgi:hypothetical protein